MRKTWSLLCLAVMALVPIACSSSVELSYFSLPQPPLDEVESEYSFKEDAGVESFSSHPPLRRQEIILRQEDSPQLLISNKYLWWTVPEEMVTESLKNYLDMTKVFRVWPYPTSHPIRFVIEGVLDTFEFRVYPEHWQVCVALRVYLVDRENEAVVWDSGLISAGETSAPDVKEATYRMGRSLNQIWQQIVPRMQQALAEWSEKAGSTSTPR